MLGVALAEHVQVDAVQDLDPVVAVGLIDGAASSSTAARRLSGSTRLARSRPRPGARAARSRLPPRSRFLSRSRASSTASGSTSAASAVGSPCAAEDPRDLGAQLRRPREPKRRQQSESHRLAVAIAPVAARRLDRVADRVTQVEHRAAPGVALVGGDDLELGPRAGEDHVAELCRGRGGRSSRTRSHSSPPAIRAGLHDLDEPRRQLLPRKAWPASRVSASTAAGR